MWQFEKRGPLNIREFSSFVGPGRFRAVASISDKPWKSGWVEPWVALFKPGADNGGWASN
jgi:hypothetical protein